MRRKDREKGSAFAFEVLRDCEYATFAKMNNTPHGVSLFSKEC